MGSDDVLFTFYRSFLISPLVYGLMRRGLRPHCGTETRRKGLGCGSGEKGEAGS